MGYAACFQSALLGVARARLLATALDEGAICCQPNLSRRLSRLDRAHAGDAAGDPRSVVEFIGDRSEPPIGWMLSEPPSSFRSWLVPQRLVAPRVSLPARQRFEDEVSVDSWAIPMRSCST
jgi:hypothetical protein